MNATKSIRIAARSKKRAHLAPLALLLALCAGTAQAGRHGVEDAALLSQGECELELAYDRLAGGRPQGTVELACRPGAVQFIGELEHARTRPESQTAYAVEAKWARDLRDDWRAGVLLRAQWGAHQRPRYEAATVLGLLTWKARPNLDLHLNLGREFVHQGGNRTRWAVAPEWHVREDLSLLAERLVIDGTHFMRGTVRWEFREGWGIEAGRAVRLRGPEPSRWTFSVIIDLGQD
jgi:hypothetical protein